MKRFYSQGQRGLSNLPQMMGDVSWDHATIVEATNIG
jgi:hypothetical protein